MRGCDLNLATFHPCDVNEGDEEWPVFGLGAVYKVIVELAILLSHVASPWTIECEVDCWQGMHSELVSSCRPSRIPNSCFLFPETRFTEKFNRH